MTLFDKAWADWKKEYNIPDDERFDKALKSIVELAQLEVWKLLEEVLSHPSIASVQRGEWTDGEKGWFVSWAKGGYSGGDTLEYAVKSAKQELEL